MAYEPTPQTVHERLPAVEDAKPGAQSEQLKAPSLELNWPGGHDTHAVERVAAAYVPARQRWNTAAPAEPTLAPSGEGRHAEAETLPTEGLYDPGGHELQR